MTRTKRYINYSFFLFIGVLSGWLLSPSEDPAQPFVTYHKGNTITDTVHVYRDTTLIVTEVTPGPERIVYVTANAPIDTAELRKATVVDWNTLRTYKGTAYKNDTVGVFDYEATVQYNKLQSIVTNVTPVRKNILLPNDKKVKPQFFLSGDVSTNNYFSVGGGVKINKVGYQLKYLKEVNGKDKGFVFGVILFI